MSTNQPAWDLVNFWPLLERHQGILFWQCHLISDHSHIPMQAAYKSVAIADGVRLPTFWFLDNIFAS